MTETLYSWTAASWSPNMDWTVLWRWMSRCRYFANTMIRSRSCLWFSDDVYVCSFVYHIGIDSIYQEAVPDNVILVIWTMAHGLLPLSVLHEESLRMRVFFHFMHRRNTTRSISSVTSSTPTRHPMLLLLHPFTHRSSFESIAFDWSCWSIPGFPSSIWRQFLPPTAPSSRTSRNCRFRTRNASSRSSPRWRRRWRLRLRRERSRLSRMFREKGKLFLEATSHDATNCCWASRFSPFLSCTSWTWSTARCRITVTIIRNCTRYDCVVLLT